jgi:hypothetical protein
MVTNSKIPHLQDKKRPCRELGALVHHQGVLMQLENPLSKYQGPSSKQSAVLTYHCRELYLTSEVGRLHLAGPKLSQCIIQKLKKARVSQAGTSSTQLPGNSGIPKQGETSTQISKRPKPDDSNPTERITPPKCPRDIQDAGQH